MAKTEKFWVADSETDPFLFNRIPEPFLWGLLGPNEEYYEFEKTEDFISFVKDKKIIIYAHNGGKFDWHFITKFIPDYEPLTIIAGRLSKFKIGECEFRDSYNLIPAPLSAYKKDDISYDIFEKGERNKPENMKAIKEYLKADCVYLRELVVNFIEEYGVNLTIAGTAIKVWSKLSQIKKPQSSASYYEKMSQYYYGGRVECFQKGIIEKDFSVIDINSAYPYAMTFDHPHGFNYQVHEGLPEHLNDSELSRCFISLTTQSLGAFPVREKTGLSFPNDGEIRRFKITGHEYIAARDNDCLKKTKIETTLEYVETVNFTEYVNHFFDLKASAKKSGDSAQYLFAKIFLNSLYGKFASNPANYQEYMTLPLDVIDASHDDGWSFCKPLDHKTGVVCRPLEEEKRRYYNVAVAASITGLVRAYLFKAMKNCEGLMYCDTDCIVAEKISGVNMSAILGDWELEAECEYAAIAGKKLYAFRKKDGKFKIASKGVRLTPDQIIGVAEGKEILNEPFAPTFSVKSKTKFTPRKIVMR